MATAADATLTMNLHSTGENTISLIFTLIVVNQVMILDSTAVDVTLDLHSISTPGTFSAQKQSVSISL